MDPAVLIERLAAAGHTIATAESLTAGLVAARLADVPGASRVLLGGLITYCNRAKETLLGVDAGLIERESAVSGAVACQMALGAARAFGARWALATTGVGGPGPDERGNGQGLVYVALAGPDGPVCRRYELEGTREQIRRRAVDAALALLDEMTSR